MIVKPSQCHLRIARHTHQLAKLVSFYQEHLGFERLGGFQNHDGFDGVMLGHPGQGFHLEFTSDSATDALHESTAATSTRIDDLLVFYIPDMDDWEQIVAKFDSSDIPRIDHENPYWNHHGRTYLDPDGYRIVLHRGPWHGS